MGILVVNGIQSLRENQQEYWSVDLVRYDMKS